jgi:hypothetical protein
MQYGNLKIGRALTLNRARTACFEDSSWDDRLERLVKLTQRTSLIIDLTGTDATPARIKSYTQQRLQACGIAPNRPRGNPPSYESKAFLKPDDDRLDAAYLVALHFGPRGPGEFSEVEADLGQALDKRLEVYARYCSDLYPLKHGRQQEPRLGFEDYVVLIHGIKAKVIALHVCRDCKGCQPYSTLQTVTPSCPFCNRMKLDMGMARSEVERRLQQHRCSRQQHLAGRHCA